jgi:hypothetical protein
VAYDDCHAAGPLGSILIFYGKANGNRFCVVATVGQNGVKPNTPYKLGVSKKLQLVKKPEKRTAGMMDRVKRLD